MEGEVLKLVRLHYNCVQRLLYPLPLTQPSLSFLSFPPVFQDSYVRAKTWVKELQRQASANIIIALAGNKADLASDNSRGRIVDFEVS